jgi:hypothetical protein
MFRIFLSSAILAFLAPFIPAQAQTTCNELFISEYVEGTGNNKALEIYNPGRTAVDLTKYRLTRWQNGTSTWQPNYSDTLSGTLGPNSVLVAVIDRRNPNGTGVDTPVASALQAKADIFLSKDYNRNFSMSFNGDDAMSLDKLVGNQWVPVDIIGKIGERPINAWTDSFPYNHGIGLWLTANKTLIRKRTVIRGVTVNPTHFNGKLEWNVFNVNMFDSLGTHHCDCDKFPASVLRSEEPIWNVFPNPATGGRIEVFTAENARFMIFDVSGREIRAIKVEKGTADMGHYRIALPAGISGTCFLQIITDSGKHAVKKVTLH